MMNYHASLLAVVLALGLAITPYATTVRAEQETTVQAVFDKMDKDRNGRVDEVEFTLEKGQLSSFIDKNADGDLTREEVLISDEAFADVNTNGDGRVDYIEFIRSGLGNFENLERDRDGVVVFEELEAWINN